MSKVAKVACEAVSPKTDALQDAIFNSANFSSIATDEKGLIQTFNVGAEHMLGYAADEVVNRMTPADIADAQEIIARARSLSQELETPIAPGFQAMVFNASRGIEDIYELTYIRKDGSRCPAIVSVTAIHDGLGNITGYLLIGTDNTARKAAEEALLRAGALQNAIFSSADFSCIATDAKGTIQVFSTGAEHMLGYAANEVVDKATPTDLHDPLEVIARANKLSLEYSTNITPGFEALIFRASRGIQDIFEITNIRKDGSRFPAVVSVAALRDAQTEIIGYLCIGTDNTARKQVESQQRCLDQKLRDHQFYTRSLIESNIDALMTTDPIGIITDVNKQMETLTGCSRDELIGAPFKSYFTDPERAEAGLLRVLSGSKVADYELTARSWDGKETVVSYNATPYHDRERKLQGMFAAARDVTERKRFEGTLREANAELERTKALAEAANLAKSDFLAAMSHEIRTPMNAILGMSDVLAESELNAEQMQYVDVFRRAGANLLILINDILDLSKIEAGQMELEHVEFDLEDVVDQAIELTGVKTRAKGIVLLSHLSPDLAPAFVGDPTRLRQVLINLLGNAVKFTEKGQVLLKVQNHESGRPGEVTFAISDTGIGIAPDKLESIFDRFAQADSSITRRYGGTGLGLEISRRLVQGMGGELTGTSLAGEGSTFRFNAQFEPGTQTRRKAPVEMSDFRGCRALVIDDNATNRFILGETLNVWGIESTEIGTPAEALANLSAAATKRKPYSLVLVDSEMPGMDGFETTACIKQIAPELPVIMFTSDARPGDTKRRRDAGLSGYAIKPVKRSELLRLLWGAMPRKEDVAAQTPGSESQTAPVPLKPLNILIAEDSEDNRLLVKVYLKGSPHRLTFADDGKAAVDLFSVENFDLILMDMQMPIMDGLTATRTIRAIESERGGAAIPIIGLTASALPQDMVLTSRAGCTQHLSKPISKHKLLSTIEGYGPMKNTRDDPPQDGSPQINIEVPPGLEEIVPGYLATRRTELPEMRALLDASDFRRLATLGHDLKGTGASYGFPALTRIGTAVEDSAKQMDAVAISTQLNELADYLVRVQLTNL